MIAGVRVQYKASLFGFGAFVGFVTTTLCGGLHDASAGRSPRRSPWTRALEPSVEHAPARGVQAVAPPPTGRVRVMGGRFRMGSSPTDMVRALVLCHREIGESRCGDQDMSLLLRSEASAHDVTLAPYAIDRTEVTVQAYARCVEAGPCAPAEYPRGDPRFDRPNLPVTYVRWDDAATYCGWANGRLPTEAEWEFAARGATRRDFPWGSIYNPHLCNHGSLAQDESDATDGFVGLSPVGSFPDGKTPLGILDLAGNAAEWVADLYDVDQNGVSYSAQPQNNPKGPPSGIAHVIRGGSFAEGGVFMRSAARQPMMLLRSSQVGFRCAYD